MKPEDLGILLAKGYIDSKDFRERLDKLALDIVETLIRGVVVEMREHVEREIGYNVDHTDDVAAEKHYEMAMAFEGDVGRAVQKALAAYIEEY